MLKVNDDQVVGTKKEIQDFLWNKMKWFQDYANPFEEARMVFYINNGLNILSNIECDDNAEIKMFDKDGQIQFNVNE